MNLDYIKLLYCEFQKYELMTIVVVGGQPKKKNTEIPVIKQQNAWNTLFYNLCVLLVNKDET